MKKEKMKKEKMKKVFYMKTRKHSTEDENNHFLDKIGGLPTHKPDQFPIYFEDEEYGFVMQIYCDEKKFPNNNDVLCWQIYQDIREQDSLIIIEVPKGAELNIQNEGTKISRLQELIIYYEEGIEPDLLELEYGKYSDGEEDRYFSSKIGGAIPEDYISTEYKYIGQVYESIYDLDNYGLNFGIEVLHLVRNSEGKMELI